MSTQLEIDVTGFAGGTAPGSSIRVDLMNCSNPRVKGSGQLVPLSQTYFPNNGVLHLTLFDNSQILCGAVNVMSQGDCGCGCAPSPSDCGCGCAGQNKVSYYCFSFIYQGVVTSIGCYRLHCGSYKLWDLTPCRGKDCICGESNDVEVPVQTQAPLGAKDGVNTVYTLFFAPTILWLSRNGVYQTEGIDYTLDGNVITTTTPVRSNEVFTAQYVYGLCGPQIASETPAGAVDGVNAVFTLSHAPQQCGLFFYVGGVYMTNGIDYTLNGNVVTLNLAPMVDSIVHANYVWGGTNYKTITTQTPAGLINGVNRVYTLTSVPGFLAIQHKTSTLTEWLIPGIGYTQSGMTITLTTAPAIGDVLFATLWS